MQVFNTLVQHSRCDYHCSFVSWFFRIVRSLSILKFTRFLLFRLRISRCICLCVSNDEPFLCMDLASVHHLKHRKTFQFRSLFFLFATVFFFSVSISSAALLAHYYLVSISIHRNSWSITTHSACSITRHWRRCVAMCNHYFPFVCFYIILFIWNCFGWFLSVLWFCFLLLFR